MTKRWERRRSVATVLAGVILVGAVLAGCSGDDDASSSTTTTTTVDPLAETVVDACGNDLTELASAVWAIDPATGSVVWTASVPLAEGFLLRDPSGAVRVPLVQRSVNVLLDPMTGEVVGRPEAGVHEVVVDATGGATGVEGTQVVDGEQRPAQVVVGGMAVETTTAGGALAARGVDPATGSSVWTSPLTGSIDGAVLGPPVAYGDLVVVVGPRQAVPVCP